MLAVMLLPMAMFFGGNESAYLDRIENLRNESGLFADRLSDRSTISTAATGLGLLALAEGASRGLRDRAEVATLVRSALVQTVQSNPARNRGWLSHFTESDGTPKHSSEVSTIDTAIFYSGLLQAARLLDDEGLQNSIRSSLNQVDTELVMRDGVFLHGFNWRLDAGESSEHREFIPYKWNDSSEGAILYRLFDLPFPLQIRRTDYPLFVYAYPLCFFDDPTYESLLQQAIEEQIARFGYWGVTSTDGPEGYVTLDRYVISPVLIGGIATKFPQYLDSLKSLMIQPSAVSMHLPTGWTDSDDLTIDLASAYILYSRWTREKSASGAKAVLENVALNHDSLSGARDGR
jgi:hypothetical protein